jgi:hypothetical protein
LIQFLSPDDKHCVLETCRELEINTLKRICASRWSFIKNHYMMHGQQNVKFYTNVSQNNFHACILFPANYLLMHLKIALHINGDSYGQKNIKLFT